MACHMSLRFRRASRHDRGLHQADTQSIGRIAVGDGEDEEGGGMAMLPFNFSSLCR